MSRQPQSLLHLSIDDRHHFGTAVDIYTIDQESAAPFQKWVQGDRSAPIEYASALRRPGTSSDLFVRGSYYYVIIDNTGFCEAKTTTSFACHDARLHMVIR